MKKDILTKLQRAFVDEYLKSPNLNATECVRRAGYRTKYPDKIAAQLLGNTRVLIEIGRARIRRAKRTEITQDRVLRELAMIGFSDLKNYITIDELTGAITAKGFEQIPEGESRVLRSIKEDRVIKEDADGKKTTVYDKVKFELWDKPKALDMIGRHLGMFVDVNIKGKVKHEYILSMKDFKESNKKMKKDKKSG